jgi:hypothetical protein
VPEAGFSPEGVFHCSKEGLVIWIVTPEERYCLPFVEHVIESCSIFETNPSKEGYVIWIDVYCSTLFRSSSVIGFNGAGHLQAFLAQQLLLHAVSNISMFKLE